MKEVCSRAAKGWAPLVGWSWLNCRLMMEMFVEDEPRAHAYRLNLASFGDDVTRARLVFPPDRQ